MLFGTLSTISLPHIEPSQNTIWRWFWEFWNGKTLPGPLRKSGRPKSAVTSANIGAVNRMLNENSRVKYWKIEQKLRFRSNAVNLILRKKLAVKLCARWVLPRLTEGQRETNLNWSTKDFHRRRPDIFYYIMTTHTAIHHVWPPSS